MYRFAFFMKECADVKNEEYPEAVDWLEDESSVLIKFIHGIGCQYLVQMDMLRTSTIGISRAQSYLEEFKNVFDEFRQEKLVEYLAKGGKATASKKAFFESQLDYLLEKDQFYSVLKRTINLFEFAIKNDCEISFYAP